MDTASNLQDTLDKIDSYVAEKQEDIKRGEALKRLKSNPDFQLVIVEGYIETEAEKLFKILTDPTGASPYTAETIHLKLEAISHFKSYVGTRDYPGTIKMDADSAPGFIQRELEERSQVTADYARIEAEED